MKKIKKMGMGGMMKQMKGLMGGKGDELEMLAQSMDPELMSGTEQMDGPLGPNPFDGGGLPPGMGAGGLPGLGAPGGGPGFNGLPGMGMRGGSKKNRKPKNKKGKRR